MNRMTKKLFGYFAALLAFFAVTAFIGFSGVFRILFISIWNRG